VEIFYEKVEVYEKGNMLLVQGKNSRDSRLDRQQKAIASRRQESMKKKTQSSGLS